MTVKRILLSVFVMCIMCLQAQENGQYVVVISLDGFRYDYPEIHKSPNLKKIAEKDSTGYASKGTHGFLNTDKQMHGICIAVGPAFKKGRTKRKIRNVDLYPLVTQILGIVPAKVDGELKSEESLLRE